MRQMVSVGQTLNRLILDGVEAGDIAVTEQVLERMKDNIRRSITERSEADLAVGVFDTDAQ